MWRKMELVKLGIQKCRRMICSIHKIFGAVKSWGYLVKVTCKNNTLQNALISMSFKNLSQSFWSVFSILFYWPCEMLKILSFKSKWKHIIKWCLWLMHHITKSFIVIYLFVTNRGTSFTIIYCNFRLRHRTIGSWKPNQLNSWITYNISLIQIMIHL